MNDQNDLAVLIKSRVPIIVIETREEPRALQLLERVAGSQDKALFFWSVVDGLRRNKRDQNIPQTTEFTHCLRHIDATPQDGVYVLLDAHPFLNDALNVRLVREIAMEYHKVERTLVFISPEFALPKGLKRLAARFELSLPDAARIRQLVKEEADLWSARNRGEPLRGQQEAVDALVQHLTGLPLDDARRLIREAIEDDGHLNLADMPRLLRVKRDLLDEGGVLDVLLTTETLAAVGGLSKLKHWLTLRQPMFLGASDAPNLDPPKGILLLGVQGSGKSLAAKAVAGTWRLPLVRLDFASLYNKYLGETERNLRETLQFAAAMAPCVLWVDEIEKGLSSEDHDDGASRRVLGTLLTWMSERKTKVFLVATANDVTALPPELIRKGRFDEVFFVDLPDAATRSEIFRIHLSRRQLELSRFDLSALAQAAEGYSGAEIEQVIVAALYEAYARQETLSSQHLLDELKQTKPLSVLRAEDIAELREWARERTVPAH